MIIESETIGQNRYASPEATAIKTYSFNGCDGMSIGKLVNAVCCRIGAALEAQTVVKTNIITQDTNLINAYSYILSGFVDDSVDYDTVLDTAGYEGRKVREFLQDEGYVISSEDEPPAGQLPKDVKEVNDKLIAYDVLKDKLDSLANQSQQDMIDLQTDVSRRDVAFSTAVNAVRSLGSSTLNTASNF